MTTGPRWRPIAECPAALTRAVIFDPDNVYSHGPAIVADDRMAVGDRGGDGTWWVAHDQGGYAVTPTHFLDPGVPEGFPTVLDPAEAWARQEAARIERERVWAEEAKTRGTAQSQAEAAHAAELEAHWADPANWHKPPTREARAA